MDILLWINILTNRALSAEERTQARKTFSRLFQGLRPGTRKSLLSVFFRPKPLRQIPLWHTGYKEPSVTSFQLFAEALWGNLQKQNHLIPLRWHGNRKILVPTMSEIAECLIKSGYYEPNEMLFLEKYLKKDAVFVDVGAHIGLYSVFAASLVGKKGRVFAFEPSVREFGVLAANTKQMEQVSAHCEAISNKNAQKTLKIADDFHSGHNTLEDFIYEETKSIRHEKIQAITLDKFLSDKHLARLDLLKIDVEGHEEKVVEGALNTIEKFHPIIMIEVSNNIPLRKLKMLGYTFFTFHPINAKLTPLKGFDKPSKTVNVIGFPYIHQQEEARNSDAIQVPITNLPKLPLVSIITPCYNDAQFITECIESIRDQNYPNVEHIIQDGASTDGTIDTISRYAKEFPEKIKFVTEPDNGQADGLNKAIQRASGDILLVLNADDALLPHATSWAVKHLQENPDVAVVYGDVYIIDENGHVVEEFKAHSYDFEKLLCVEFVPPAQAAFIRRAHFEKVGLYADNTLDTCPDYEMWVRIGLKFPMRHATGFVTKYRRHNRPLDSRFQRTTWRFINSKKLVMDRVFDSPRTLDQIKNLRQRAYGGLYLWATATEIGLPGRKLPGVNIMSFFLKSLGNYSLREFLKNFWGYTILYFKRYIHWALKALLLVLPKKLLLLLDKIIAWEKWRKLLAECFLLR